MLALLLPLVLLAGCGKESKNDARSASGEVLQGTISDAMLPVDKLKSQKGIVIDHQVIPGANHFFDGKLEPLMESVTSYLDMRLANIR